MGKKSAPKPTPPEETAAASNSSNIMNATANAYFKNINQYTPDGSVVYNKTGDQSIYDPYTKQNYDVPIFDQTVSLSPEQQAIKEQNDSASLNLASLGNVLSDKLGNKLTDNFVLDNEATESRLYDLGRKRLDPMLAECRDSLETQLSNQGIKRGSEAYDRAMRDNTYGENDAYNQLLLTGRGQAANELFAEDNQRINQISALMSGGQVSNPNFMSTNMPTIQNTDVAGLIANNDRQKMQGWMQERQSKNDLYGGILGFGGKVIAGA